jgi:hypothetical protein
MYDVNTHDYSLVDIMPFGSYLGIDFVRQVKG